jgi:hypothetical protein
LTRYQGNIHSEGAIVAMVVDDLSHSTTVYHLNTDINPGLTPHNRTKTKFFLKVLRVTIKKLAIFSTIERILRNTLV